MGGEFRGRLIAMSHEPKKSAKAWLYGLLPIAVLGILCGAIIKLGDRKDLLPTEVPPIEELSIQRIIIKPYGFQLEVMNDGPDELTIAQVSIEEAYWNFTMEPADKTLGHLEHGVITIINYHWVAGETYAITIISRNGITWNTEIPVALETPVASSKTTWFFIILGVIIGVIPVALGLLWLPVLPYLSDRYLRFLSALTVGLLIYLGLDTMKEGFEFTEELAGSYNGEILLIGVGLLVFIGLMTLKNFGKRKVSDGGDRPLALRVSCLIALGIGLHNLGEGLVVGSAFVHGDVSMGTRLVLGFTLHNITEGLAIVVPLAACTTGVARIVGLGLLAGLPTIAGTLIGGFFFSQLWAVIFFGMAAGAIFQVVWIISQGPSLRSSDGEMAVPENFIGVFAGIAIMFVTGLLI